MLNNPENSIKLAQQLMDIILSYSKKNNLSPIDEALMGLGSAVQVLTDIVFRSAMSSEINKTETEQILNGFVNHLDFIKNIVLKTLKRNSYENI